jgi:hypothetical protein
VLRLLRLLPEREPAPLRELPAERDPPLLDDPPLDEVREEPLRPREPVRDEERDAADVVRCDRDEVPAALRREPDPRRERLAFAR